MHRFRRYRMLQVLISAALAVTAVLPAAANAVRVSPGTLASLLAEPASCAELILSGTVDARDLFFIADSMPALRSLDLGAVTVEAYEGAALKQLVRYDAATIPTGTFAGCGIERVVLPASGMTIGDAAFAGSALTEVIVPAGHEIGAGAFAGCNRLVSVRLGVDSISDGAFSGCPRLTDVNAPDVVSIGRSAFRNCALLSDFTAPAGLRNIGRDAFAGCSSLESFDFGVSLAEVGESAFSGSGLRTVDMSACVRLTRVGDWAFSHCNQLGTVRLPAGLQRLGTGLFFGCEALWRIDIPGNCAAIDAYALKGSSAMSGLTVPASVGYIGDYAMAGMTGLEHIYVHEHTAVPELGENVWAGVDQPLVSLHVLELFMADFAGAGQWQDFALVQVAGEADGIVLSPQPQVRGRLEGDMLHVDFGGLDARTLAVYDVSGLKLAETAVGGRSHAEVDTAAWPARIFLVRVALADGRIVSLKLGRN